MSMPLGMVQGYGCLCLVV